MICHLIHQKRQVHAHGLAVCGCTGTVLGEADTVVGHACGNGILSHLFLRLGHQIGKRREGRELTVGEELLVHIHTIDLHSET